MVSGYGQKFKMAEASDNSCSSEDDERTWLYTTNTRLCQRIFISLISILAKFVLFEYNHVVGLRETQSYNIDESV